MNQKNFDLMKVTDQDLKNQIKGLMRWEYINVMANTIELKPQLIVEIGVYCGDMSVELRKLYPEAHLYLIDPFMIPQDYARNGGNVWAGNSDAQSGEKKVRERFAHDYKATIIKGTSEEACPQVPSGLDIVFIDGNHSYEYVKKDIEMWLPKVREGGLICGHDYGRHGDTFGIKKAVVEKFGSNHIYGGIDRDDVWVHPV